MTGDSFTGAWKLVSSEMRSAGGQVQYPLGEDCEGSLVIADDGSFSAQLMRADRTPFASHDLLRGTNDEIRDAYQGYVAFWAQMEVDREKREISYVVQGSLFPNWIGQRNVRYYEFNENRLTPEDAYLPDGRARGHRRAGLGASVRCMKSGRDPVVRHSLNLAPRESGTALCSPDPAPHPNASVHTASPSCPAAMAFGSGRNSLLSSLAKVRARAIPSEGTPNS